MNVIVKNPSSCLAAGLLALLGAPAFAAEDIQPHADIERAAVAYVEARAGRFPVAPEVAVGRLDSRLRLPRCELPLDSFESPGGLSAGRAVVGVRCSGRKPWKLYVPVQIKLPADVVVLNKPLRRGDLIGAGDLGTRRADLAALRGQYYQDAADVVGQRMKRHVAANAVLTPVMIDAGRLVQRGSRVTIISNTGAIEVRMAGKALGHGGRGDQIRVKNQTSGRTITATVVDRGVVRAGP